MAEAEDHAKELKTLGWHLSSDGIALCVEQCKEKGWKITTNNLQKIALDADLRSVGTGALSEDISRNLTSEVNGPIVLQIQKVKNIAVPSRQQHDPSPSKRLLRLQLTDSHVLVSAVEFNGPINNLSPVTPPGTKVKLLGKVAVQNSFLLLTKTSLEVLGGTVEVLHKKWKTQKVLGDVQRTNIGKGDGPPPFVPFKDTSKTSDKRSGGESRPSGPPSKSSGSGGTTQKSTGARSQQREHKLASFSNFGDSQRQQGRTKGEERPTKVEATVKSHSKEREGKEDSKHSMKGTQSQIISQSKERGRDKEYKSHQQTYEGRTVENQSSKAGGAISGNEFKETQRSHHEEPQYERGRREGRGRGRGRTDIGDGQYPSLPLRSGRLDQKADRNLQRLKEEREGSHERGRRGRGRGRGRRGRNYDEDDDYDYQPSTRPTTGLSLGDFFQEKLTLHDTRSRSSHFGWYEEDYEHMYNKWEQPYDSRHVQATASRDYVDHKDERHCDTSYSDQKTRAKEGNRRDDDSTSYTKKTRAKEASRRDDDTTSYTKQKIRAKEASRRDDNSTSYTTQKTKTKDSETNRGDDDSTFYAKTKAKEGNKREDKQDRPSEPKSKTSGSLQGAADVEESHWDWVGMATGAPASARKK